MIKRALFGLALALWAPGAAAQSSPGLYNGQIPTAAQWNSYFAAKQDLSPGAILGPGAATPGHLVLWGSSYPTTTDGGAVPSVTAGSCITVTGSRAYAVAVTPACLALRGFIDGLVLTTPGSAQTFTMAIGAASDSTSSVQMPLGASLTKTIASTWTAGANNGCLDTGSVANNTWYHIFLIERTNLASSDVLCSLSLTPALPANYSYYRRVGSLLTNGSANWVKFVQWGDEFRWDTPVNDLNTSTLGTTATTPTITVPPGVTVLARIRGWASSATPGTSALVSSPLVATPVAGTPTGEVSAIAQVAGVHAALTLDVLTDTSQHVSAVASAASTSLALDTYGWIDRRGRNN